MRRRLAALVFSLIAVPAIAQTPLSFNQLPQLGGPLLPNDLVTICRAGTLCPELMLGSNFLLPQNNLSDIPNPAIARTNLGLGSAVGLNLGTSVNNPGTGTLEAILPLQTITGASHAFVTADLFEKTRRSNSGTAMTDTLPPSTATGMANGTRVDIANVDATATDTLTAGAGTTIAAGCAAVGPGRDVMLVYDAPNTIWRGDANTCGALLGANNLSDVANAATARANLGLAIGTNVEAWSANLDTLATTLPVPTTQGGTGATSISVGIDARAYGADPTGSTDSTADLTTACSAATAAKQSMVLTGTFKIASSVTYACEIQFSPGSMLVPTAGANATIVTLKGYIYADSKQQIFATPGALILQTGNIATASPTHITSVTIAGILPGALAVGATIPPGDTVASAASTTVVLNVASTASANVSGSQFSFNNAAVTVDTTDQPFTTFVSVGWWGASAAAAAGTDAAGAFRMASGSYRRIIVPAVPITLPYLLGSYDANPFAGISGGNFLVADLYHTSEKWDGFGAYLQPIDATHGNSNWFNVDFGTDIEIYGMNFLPPVGGFESANFASAITMTQDTNVHVHDLSFPNLSGNCWGGRSYFQTAIRGDGWAKVDIDHIYAPGISQVFDIAYLQHVTLDKIDATGQGDLCGTSGNNAGLTAFGINTDLAVAAASWLNFPLNTRKVTISNSSYSNFGVGGIITAGEDYTIGPGDTFSGNNRGDSPYQAAGLVLGYDANSGDNTYSHSDPLYGVSVIGNRFLSNGLANTSPYGGVLFSSNGANVSGDLIGGARIDDNDFENNYNYGVQTYASGTAAVWTNPGMFGINTFPAPNATQLGPADLATVSAAGGIRLRQTNLAAANGANDVVLPIQGEGVYTFNTVSIGGSPNGTMGQFMMSGGAVVLMNTSNGVFVASTSPSSGKIGVGYDGTNYAIYNNEGNAIVVNVTCDCTTQVQQ